MSVPIQARGVTLGVAVLTRFRRPDPFTPDDVLLAEEITARAAVCIDNARRFSRERETALALQRSLLPQRPAAARPPWRPPPAICPAARAGVGGDWFDVIPLSGMRVAMVVGDVVGHGIQASATMGRLRTAVRTLADIDLAPDELLTHLDDLVVRLSDGGRATRAAPARSARPVCTRSTTRSPGAARWPGPGIPPPVVVLARTARPQPIELPAGPPLGVGGLPFESAELELPEGSVLALYTDGLIETRERDVGRRSPAAVRGAGRRPRTPWTRPATGSCTPCSRRRRRRRRGPAARPHPGAARRPGRDLGHPRRPRAGRADPQAGRASSWRAGS